MTQTKGHGRINYHISIKKREALKQWSRKQGLTLQDGLDKIVDMGLGIPLSAWNPQPVDTSGFGRQMVAPAPRDAMSVYSAPAQAPAPEPEPEWSDPDPDYDPDFDYHTQIIQGVSHEKSVDEVKLYCRQLRRPDWEPSAEVVRAAAAEWAAKQSAGVVPSADRFTPATHDNIPADWVNEYGLTLAQQNALGREDDLEYGPPTARPGVAH